MGKERRVGTMERLFTLVHSSKVKNMAKADFNGKMAAFMKETLTMDSFKAMVNTTLLIWINGTRENSGSVIWRAEV